jgi:hypothetical protein
MSIVEHIIEDADAGALGDHEQLDRVTLVVEFDAHGLTIKKKDSDGVLSDSYFCLDLQSGVLRAFTSNDEESNGVHIGVWGDHWFPSKGHLGLWGDLEV